jgi:uncharacterized membrane protein YecN with MAPEG domain
MKKGFAVIAVTLLLILSCAAVALAENAFWIGYSYRGDIEIDGTSLQVGSGFDFSYEYTFDGNSFESGFGVEYQLDRNIDEYSLKFQYIPVYGLFAFEISETETNNIYLLGKLGYNFLIVSDLPATASARNGYYYACGLGMKIGPYFRTQALYEVYNGSVVASGVTQDLTHTAYTLKCGLAF